MSSDVRKGASKQVGNTRTAGKKEYGQARGRTAGKRTNGVHGTEEKRSGYSGPCRTEGAEAPCFFLWSVIYLIRRFQAERDMVWSVFDFQGI